MGKATKDMLGRDALIAVNAARDLLLGHLGTSSLDRETVRLEEALDRVLAVSVCSHENLPPHPRSVMDGFAVIAKDTFGASESSPCYLEITGDVAMGEMPEGAVTQGTCFRIATGGFMPHGADAVVMHEHTVPIDGTLVEIVKSCGSGVNTIGTGEDIGTDELALPAGKLLRPQDLGLLAALGVSQVTVFRRVRVGILSTGDEIVPHQTTPAPGQIRNVNAITLAALARRCGAMTVDYGIVADSREIFFSALSSAIAENDLVLFSGSSSVGARDLGEQAISALGPPGVLVHGVRLKPGKPVIIGLHGSKPIFGLPGHPISAMVCFELFVEPAIAVLSGDGFADRPANPAVSATLSRNINSAAGRLDLVRVLLRQGEQGLVAEPVLGRSGAISTLARAHGYFFIAEDSQGASEGATVEVYLYR
ncbi:MAG: gephyrin-like molybdotransferase Glp [Desulfopila sp.]